MENNLATYNHPSEFQVWVTNDYGLFKTLNGNRDIAFARVDKIAKSIKNIGYRPQPILVNGNMEIIDGQGRFQALKNMGLPILYIIDKNAGIKECISMNIYQEKWNVMDYVKSYAEQGNNDYILLYEMIKQFPKLHLRVIVPVCTGNYGSDGFDILKKGRFKVGRDKKEIVKILEYLMQFYPYEKYMSNFDRAAKVFLLAYEHPEIDKDAMLKAVETRFQKITPYNSIEEAVKTFGDIYNYKRRDKVYFEILYSETVSMRSIKIRNQKKNAH